MATTLPNTGAVIPAMAEPADQAVNNAAFTAIDETMGTHWANIAVRARYLGGATETSVTIPTNAYYRHSLVMLGNTSSSGMFSVIRGSVSTIKSFALGTVTQAANGAITITSSDGHNMSYTIITSQ